MKDNLYEKMNIYIDLAVEAHDLVRGQSDSEVSGVIMDKEELGDITVTTITITNTRGEKELGRPQGNYITIDAPVIKENSYEKHKEVVKTLAKHLTKLMDLNEKSNILVVGLGNWQATPDALGPKVVDKILVTRHLFYYTPEEIKGQMRKVSAISPGVLGLTGIETAEVIRGLTEHVKPDYVIAIDALAAGALERIATTIQITDTGINPGSGIGNHRKGLNKETLGCNVIAIGVPTVVNAAVIAQRTIEELLDQSQNVPGVDKLDDDKLLMDVMNNVLAPFRENLMVTPKEVDELIGHTSKIIANSLNITLHPGISENNFETYLH